MFILSLAAEIQVQVTPDTLFVGETGQYRITSTVGDPIIESFPRVKNIRWRTNTSYTETQIINFKRKDTRIYPFSFRKPGTYRIPAIPVRIGRQTVHSPPKTVVVKERKLTANNRSWTLDDLIFLEVRYNGKKELPKAIYLGEEITLSIHLYVDNRLKIYTSRFDQQRSFTNPKNYFPDLDLENIVFRDVSSQNPHNSKLLYDQEASTIVDQQKFKLFVYHGVISGVEPGTIRGTIEHTVPLVDASQKKDPFRDSFGFFSQAKQIFSHSVHTNIPSIAVKSIPEDTNNDGYFLGLIGNWDLQLSLDRPSVTVGEDVTLTLQAKGEGAIRPLKAPELQLPGIRIYPPEVKRDVLNHSGSIKWVLVPFAEKKHLSSISFKTFSPETETFQEHTFPLNINILPAKNPAVATSVLEDFSLSGEPENIPHNAIDILYIKPEKSDDVLLPLWKNVAFPLGILTFASPLGYVILSVIIRHRRRLEENPAFHRQKKARKERKHIIRLLQQSSPEKIPSITLDHVVPYLSALHDLPLGVSVQELINHMDDPELTKILQQAEQESFMPGKKGTIPVDILIKKI